MAAGIRSSVFSEPGRWGGQEALQSGSEGRLPGRCLRKGWPRRRGWEGPAEKSSKRSLGEAREAAMMGVRGERTANRVKGQVRSLA